MTYAVITAATPGPNNIMSMTNGMRRGFRKALPFNFGILAGFSAVMLLCTLLCSVLSSLIPRIKYFMLAAGAVYMLYLAWETFRSGDEIKEGKAGEGFGAGLFLQFVNAKIYIYGIMSMEAYILPVYQGSENHTELSGRCAGMLHVRDKGHRHHAAAGIHGSLLE